MLLVIRPGSSHTYLASIGESDPTEVVIYSLLGCSFGLEVIGDLVVGVFDVFC